MAETGIGIEEILDHHGASDDLMAIMVAAEEDRWQKLASTSQKRSPASCVNERLRAVGLVGEIVHRVAHLRPFFADVVSTMDSCSEDLGAWEEPLAVPSFCLAAIRLRLKLEAQGCYLTSALQEFMVRVGVPPPLVTEALVNAAEHRILQCTEWQLGESNLQSWLRLLLIRVKVQLHVEFEEGLQWCAENCQRSAMFLTAWRPETQHISRPRLLAVGLLSLSLVKFSILPLHVLRPPDLDKEQWESLYFEGLLQSQVPDSQVSEGPGSDAVLLIIAQAAFLDDVSEILGAAKDALTSMSALRRSGPLLG